MALRKRTKRKIAKIGLGVLPGVGRIKRKKKKLRAPGYTRKRRIK